mgnify:FL=1
MEKPKHYKNRTINNLDVIDIVKEWDLNFNEGNILKYLVRTKGQRKSDLIKIIDYAQRELNYLEENINIKDRIERI